MWLNWYLFFVIRECVCIFALTFPFLLVVYHRFTVYHSVTPTIYEILGWTFYFWTANRTTWPSGLVWVQNISTPHQPTSPNLRKPGPTDQSATVGWQCEPSLLLSFFFRNKLSKLSSLFFFSSIIQPGPCIFMKKREEARRIYIYV